jgi:hypothetical protein
VVIPSFRPVGGIVKMLDYAGHALDLGRRVAICCPQPYRPGLPLFAIERFSRLAPGGQVEHVAGFAFGVEPPDLVLFTWPEDYGEIAARLAGGTAPDRVVHLVQNVRHANPAWLDGQATRLLTRPLSRIMVSRETLDACLPYLNPHSLTRVIPLGHAWEYFAKRRRGGLPRTINVGFTTWKSSVGEAVEQALAGDRRFRFRSIREAVSWKTLRRLYHWADVMLGTPGPEEGFYLVGLEALAAGALLIVADGVGNRAYCRWGENCLPAELESPSSYVEALERVAGMGPAEILSMRRAGYAVLGQHTLAEERRRFGEFLGELEGRPPAG